MDRLQEVIVRKVTLNFIVEEELHMRDLHNAPDQNSPSHPPERSIYDSLAIADMVTCSKDQ
jgi:hypothetical protein